MKYLIVFFLAISSFYAQAFDFDDPSAKRHFVYDNQNRHLGTWERSGSTWNYQPQRDMGWRSKVLPSTGIKVYTQRRGSGNYRYNRY